MGNARQIKLYSLIEHMRIMKLKRSDLCISPEAVRILKLTNTCVKIATCVFQTGCQFSSAVSAMSLGLCVWRIFSGMKITCWTTGSWQCCLSLGQVTSIPVWSTIIYRSFGDLYAFPCARASKLNPIYVSKLDHSPLYLATYSSMLVHHQ